MLWGHPPAGSAKQPMMHDTLAQKLSSRTAILPINQSIYVHLYIYIDVNNPDASPFNVGGTTSSDASPVLLSQIVGLRALV